jgi:glycosyltransferase involved in cell wall biosynthesis
MSAITVEALRSAAVGDGAVPPPAIIIPAHNEEASIGRCLSALLSGSLPGEFEVIVACNGCTDRTAEVARSFGPQVRVIEIETGNKVLAINIANRAARGYPRLYLDADLEISADDARKLILAASGDGVMAAIGSMELDFSGAGTLLRQYYRVWSSHAYFSKGKFGGVYALSQDGCRLAGTLPPVINDDEYVRRLMPEGGIRFVEDCSFIARMPRTFADLLRVRRRVHRGNRQLQALGARSQPDSGERGSPTPMLRLLRLHAGKPALWPGMLAYVAVNLAARVPAGAGNVGWGRDESTRKSKGVAGA